MAFLCLVADDGSGRVVQTFALKAEGGVIGRDDGADYVLSSPTVSRQHARVHRSTDGWRITQLSGTNEVLVGARSVSGSVLRRGDLVRLGTAELRFETQDPRRQRTVSAGEFIPPAQVSRRISAPIEIAMAERSAPDLYEPSEESKTAMREARRRPERINSGTMPVITKRDTASAEAGHASRRPAHANAMAPAMANESGAASRSPLMLVLLGMLLAGAVVGVLAWLSG